MNEQRIMIGTFTQVSNKMRASDPCYDKDVWCAHCVDRVAKGEWIAEIIVSDEGEWGQRVSKLIVSHKDVNDHVLIDDPTFEAGVDSGQLGFFDDLFYLNGAVLPKAMIQPSSIGLPMETSRDIWYSVCCDLTLKAKAGVLPNGAVARSGFGDGCYPVIPSRDELGRLRRLTVIFIGDEEEEAEDEEPEKPTIRFNRRGESGNIFWILRALVDECKRIGIEPTVYKEMQERVLAAESYEDALAIIGEKVNLIDATPLE